MSNLVAGNVADLAPLAKPIRYAQRAMQASPYPSADLRLVLLERAFGPTGGMIGADDMAQRLRSRWDQPISLLARWIVSRDVLSIVWQAQTMLPLFQFDDAATDLRPEVRAIARELAPVFDDWQLCVWFAQPNTALGDRIPVDLVDREGAAVLDAARAERFIARG